MNSWNLWMSFPLPQTKATIDHQRWEIHSLSFGHEISQSFCTRKPPLKLVLLNFYRKICLSHTVINPYRMILISMIYQHRISCLTSQIEDIHLLSKLSTKTRYTDLNKKKWKPPDFKNKLVRGKLGLLAFSFCLLDRAWWVGGLVR